MNAARRKELLRIRNILDNAYALIDSVKDDLETVASEERDYFDNMHENLQNGDRGQKASETADSLESCLEMVNDMHANLEDICGQLETATE